MKILSVEELYKINQMLGDKKECKLKISGNSMYPTFRDGDTVDMVLFNGAIKSLDVGKIIVYQKSNNIIVHRIIKKYDIIKVSFYVTKGDNNKYKDRYLVRKKDIIGYIKQ